MKDRLGLPGLQPCREWLLDSAVSEHFVLLPGGRVCNLKYYGELHLDPDRHRDHSHPSVPEWRKIYRRIRTITLAIISWELKGLRSIKQISTSLKLSRQNSTRPTLCTIEKFPLNDVWTVNSHMVNDVRFVYSFFINGFFNPCGNSCPPDVTIQDLGGTGVGPA